MRLDDPYFRLQAARRAHRAAAHKYARTKKTLTNKFNHKAAANALEKAALVFALCAAEYGSWCDAAAPAMSALTKEEREAYQAAVNPEPEKP